MPTASVSTLRKKDFLLMIRIRAKNLGAMHDGPSPVFFRYAGIQVTIVIVVLFLVMGFDASGSEAVDPAKVEFFEKNIRPVLVDNCYKCHGENPEKIKGGLILSDASGLLVGGDLGPVIVPGQPERSRLIESIRYTNEDLQMPPKGKLPDRVIAEFERWVADGATDPRVSSGVAEIPGDTVYDFSQGRKHWAYQAMVDYAAPELDNDAWVQQPLDRFIRAMQVKKGVTPAPPADKRTLIRRATFDLLGLPPTPDEVEAFVSDDSPDAFAKVVNRLLESPHYGERWGRHWLDVARYADSNGLGENVGFPYAYRYRDYVIKSFNDDKPYDQFIHEQIAGDLMPKPESEEAYYDQLIATGFLMVGAKFLGELDVEKREMDIVDEQLDVTAKAFMGKTLGCARCHDHKFDPIPTKDYYAMAGIFKSTQVMPARYRFGGDPITRPLAPEEDIEAHRVYNEKLDDAQEELRRFTSEMQENFRDIWRGDTAKYLIAGTEIRDMQEEYVREAEEFEESNLFVDLDRFGEGIGVVHYISEDISEPHFVEWKVNVDVPGDYTLSVRYANRGRRRSRGSTGIEVIVNGEQINDSAFKMSTGGRGPESQQWGNQGTFTLKQGENRIRIQADRRMIPPIDQYAVIPAYEGSPSWDRRNFLIERYDLQPTVLDNWTCYMRNTLRKPDPALSIWNEFAKAHESDEHSRDKAASHTARILREIDAKALDTLPILRSVLTGIPPQNLSELAGRYQTLLSAIGTHFDLSELRRLRDDDEEEGEEEESEEEGEDEESDETGKPKSTGILELAELMQGATSPFSMPVDFNAIASEETLADLKRLRGTVEQLRNDEPDPLEMAMVAKDWEGEGRVGSIPIHVRGNHLTKSDTLADRGFLQVLENLIDAPEVPTDESGRLQFAQWLTDSEHPLTARVMVNRIWLHHFGAGIVRSPSNFGLRGETPSHPELLDYLAMRFIEDGWSIKSMHRRIMLSAAYQMSADYNEVNAAIDYDNNYLWRMNWRRLEAESIRDTMLAVADRLDTTMFGHHPEYEGDERHEPESLKSPAFYVTDRRSVYIPVVRSMEYDFFKTFDYLDASLDIPQRPATVIAPQALYVMNSPMVMDLARNFADSLLNLDVSDEQRVRVAFERAYSRLPNQTEIAQALAYLGDSEGAESAEERHSNSWANLCHVMLASSEFVYIN
jgi:hypothetical protein